MEVPDNIVENLFLDFQKKDINKFMRGKIIKKYIDGKKLSGRAFSKQFNLSKSTVEDWLLWTKITESEYNTMKKKGLTHTEIYRTLRENKGEESENIIVLESNMDRHLIRFITNCKKCMNHYPPKSKKTDSLIDEAKQLIEVLDSHYNQ
jgi:hypothetical protein